MITIIVIIIIIMSIIIIIIIIIIIAALRPANVMAFVCTLALSRLEKTKGGIANGGIANLCRS